MNDIPSVPDCYTGKDMNESRNSNAQANCEILKNKAEYKALKNDYEELKVETEYKQLLNAEVRQRFLIKNLALALSFSVIVFMGMLIAVSYSYVLGQPSVAFYSPYIIVVMFAVPVFSMTTITVMLLIGAFRRFKDSDMEKIYPPALMMAAGAAKQHFGN